MTYRDSLDALAAALPKLGAKDADFANSLLAQAQNHATMHGYPPLSGKQWYWVRKLAEKANATAPAATNVGDFSAVIELFKTAGEHLKYPKVRLQLEDGSPVVLSVAGPAARLPGTVNLTDGKPYGQNTWFGRVDPATGAWEPSSKVDAQTTTAITALLVNFAKDPAKVASLYGKTTGACCFCSRELTDARSVTVGYGPICAEKWGLPWGEVA